MECAETTARPFVKWAGGKQALATELVQRFPAFSTYYEPFLGGASVYFELNPSKAVLCDANAWLIETYTAVRDDWQSVARALDGMENTREEFLRWRAVKPATLPRFERAAHFIYLNKTCFRGLFRVNQRGQFNVPYGAYDRRYYDADNLEAVSKSLASVEFRTSDFELSLQDVGADDFIYFDPPYFKVGGYSDFNRYTSAQFRTSDHLRLAALCRELHARGVRWALSNSDTEFVRGLYHGFHIGHVAARREINLNSRSRHITELIITNYEPGRP